MLREKLVAIALTTLVFCSTVFAQGEEEKLLSFCQNFDSFELENGLNCLKPNSTKRITYHWDSKLERELVKGFFEQIIEFNIERNQEWNTGKPTIRKYEISLLKKKDGKIAYYKIIRFEEMEDDESVECTRTISQIFLKEESNNELKVLKASFQKTYHTPLDFNALFEAGIVYGTHCGFGGSEPEYRQKMNELVRSKNKDGLINWLKSPVAEIQLYAIDGILTLKESGIKFNRCIFKMIDAVSKKKGFAHSCGGCEYSNESISSLIESIKKHHTSQIKSINQVENE
ncbi:hypothetical protein [Fluviicola taffensis]|uniref:Secreted protein n=1 Tax=Fluviicola taffensis (strain DSM 16823 / NCIMB 13979 / RW262) TaxID=755732 RepID=F2I9E1_FLUTR|nr:hypothetical protein [Fluviicola taffensis]AEA44098.1 hypothetical protein Fluta_2112 [Fluviicola taffensis DSM 16823]